MSTDEQTRHEIVEKEADRWTKLFYLFIAMGLLFLIVLAVMGYFVVQNRDLTSQVKAASQRNTVLIAKVAKLAEDGQEAKLGICSYKDDLARRIAVGQDNVDRSQAYLDDHPNGVLGISAATFRATIKIQRDALAAQRRALKALGVGLNGCPTPPNPAPEP